MNGALQVKSYRSTLVTFVLIFVIGASEAFAGGKVGIYGLRMVPRGDDARDYSRAGWGGGLHVVVPIPQVDNLFALTSGFEGINMLSETIEFRDKITGLRVEQRTNQDYFRFFVGGQIGGHGSGFLRPHVGTNLALVVYNMKTDVVIPDDYDPENEVKQKLYDETKAAFGWDVTLGLDLNFSNTIVLDGGVRYLKSFSVPQQLGENSEKIHPQYFQVYLGIGVAFEWVKEIAEEEPSDEEK